MSLAKKYPVVGVGVGIALTAVGIATHMTTLIIVGIVLIVLALIRRFRSS
jgi:hypothetical protein